MIKNFFFYVKVGILIILFNGCNKNDETEELLPPSTELLKVHVTRDYETTRSWIVVHDSNGDLLEYKELIAGNEFLLNTNKVVEGNYIDVTILEHNINNTGLKLFELKSYTNVELGQTIYINSETVPAITGVGDRLKLNVVNVPNFHEFQLSPYSGGSATQGVFKSNEKLLEISTTVNDLEQGFFFYVKDEDENLKYKIVDGTGIVGGEYTLDFNQLSSFDQIVEFKFPTSSSYSLSVSGKDSNVPGHFHTVVTGKHLGNHPHSTWKAGYLINFDQYETNLRIDYSGYKLVYLNKGAIPNGNITWPTANNFIINNKEFDKFSSNVPSTMTYRESIWNYYSSVDRFVVNWIVYSQSSTQLAKDFPSEILDLHPLLKGINLEYTQTTFYIGPRTYDNFLRVAFGVEIDDSGIDIGILFDK